MKSNRFVYFTIIICVIFIGILTRKIQLIPLFIGDVLYSVLIYFGFRFVIINSKKTTSLLLSLLFCFCIETLQLIQLDWLIVIRKTTFGHYILGEGFLWIDILCYIIGNLSASFIDWKYIKTQNLNSM